MVSIQQIQGPENVSASMLPRLFCLLTATLISFQPASAMLSPSAPLGQMDPAAHVDDRLRSAALVREMPGKADRPSSAQHERASIIRHFDAVLELLIAQTQPSLNAALTRLEHSEGVDWNATERQRRRELLLQRRWQNIARLRAYQRLGRFPKNDNDPRQPQPIFVDMHDTACAVGHLMRQSGWTAEVESIADLDNHVYVPDVTSGPLVAWVLQSGLTQEEAAIIQPSYFVPPEPRTPLAALINGETITEGLLRYENFELTASGAGLLPDPDQIHASAHPGESFDNGTNWIWFGGLIPFQFGNPDTDETVSISFAYDIVPTDSLTTLDHFYLTTRNGFESFFNFGDILVESTVLNNGEDLGTVVLRAEDFQTGHSSQLSFSPRNQLRVETHAVLTDPADFSAIMHEFTASMTGDMNNDNNIDDQDVDILRAAILTSSTHPDYNIDRKGSNVPNEADFDYLIEDIMGTGRGDGDLNRVINFVDFSHLSQNYQKAEARWSQGNFNVDDVTNFDDFVDLSNRYGASYMTSQPIPEATSLMLVIACALSLCRPGRNHGCGISVR